MSNFLEIGQTAVEISRFSNMAAAAILDFKNLKFLTVEQIKRAALHHRAKFCRNQSNYGQDMAIFRFSNMATAGVLDCKNFKFLKVEKIKRVVLYQRAKFHQNWSNFGQDMAIFRFFRDDGRRHLGLSNFVDFNGRNTQNG